MPLVWVTGISGAGKSAVCQALKASGIAAIDTDGEGFNVWVRSATGEPVVDAPDPTPADWVDTHAWHIRPEMVRTLRDTTAGVTFLFGMVANEREVWDLFDRVALVVLDNETIKHRLATRTSNAFGKHPEDLARILEWNQYLEPSYRDAGATIIDGTRPVAEVADAVLRLADGL